MNTNITHTNTDIAQLKTLCNAYLRNSGQQIDGLANSLNLQLINTTVMQTITVFFSYYKLRNVFDDKQSKKPFGDWCKKYNIKQRSKEAAMRLYNDKDAMIAMLEILHENQGDIQQTVIEGSDLIIRRYATPEGNLIGERHQHNSPVFLPRLTLLPDAEDKAIKKKIETMKATDILENKVVEIQPEAVTVNNFDNNEFLHMLEASLSTPHGIMTNDVESNLELLLTICGHNTRLLDLDDSPYALRIKNIRNMVTQYYTKHNIDNKVELDTYGVTPTEGIELDTHKNKIDGLISINDLINMDNVKPHDKHEPMKYGEDKTSIFTYEDAIKLMTA